MDGRQANRIANAHTHKLSQDEAHALERVDTITRNARGIWFGLLGALVFAGVTLLGIEDIDFFGIDRQTKLPLIGVSVPVTYFFAAGSALVAAFYVYFHLYLVQLWEVLGAAPARPQGRALSATVHPWLVSDAMIRWRSRLRRDESADKRTLASVGIVVSFVFVWLFGLTILGYFWWRSMPAHLEWMTLGLGLLLFFAFWTAARSFGAAYHDMRGQKDRPRWRGWLWRGVSGLFFIALFSITIALSWVRTEGGIDDYVIWWDDRNYDWSEEDRAKRQRHKDLRKKYGFSDYLVRANLTEKNITKLVKDWQPRDHAQKWFREQWCKREGIKIRAEITNPDTQKTSVTFPCKNLTNTQKQIFDDEWQVHRATYLDNLSRPNLANRDLRKASLTKAFLLNTDLRHARLTGANLWGAGLEGADLRNTSLEGANLWNARLESADLRRADLTGALLTGSPQNPMQLASKRLIEAIFNNAAVNQIIFDAPLAGETIGLAMAFGDDTVLRPKSMERPCHWAQGELKTRVFLYFRPPPANAPFIGRWRGWVEHNGGSWPTSEQFAKFKDVVAIKPVHWDGSGRICPTIAEMEANR